PLTHGDVSHFLHNLYEHPLGPILDVATVLTAGAGAAAKAGATLAKAGVVSKAGRVAKLGERERVTVRAPRAIAGQEQKVATKLTSTNPAIRARQKAIHKALKKLPARMPLLGETARYARTVDRLP